MRTNPVVEASTHTLGVHPHLPLACAPVPRGAGMVPPVEAQRVVESEEGVALYRQAEVTTAGSV